MKGKMKIAMDAGHGLHTAGRRCLPSLDPAQTREWKLNSRIMDRLQEALQGYDCEVLRVDDITGVRDVGLSDRVTAANDFGADLYLSMHHNAGVGGKSGGGTVVYHASDIPAHVSLAQRLYQRIMAETGLMGNRSSKVVKKAYYVLANTNMPSYLVENGFMDSLADTPVIITEAHAQKTVRGIITWLEQDCGLRHLAESEDSGQQETPSKEESPDGGEGTDPTDLSPGAAVIVNGIIYGTGSGKGCGIAKNHDRMYITGYAGERYPYCWGVAKTAGGIRQGWARAEDLKLATESAGSGRDEETIKDYPEWAAICNERNVNVRIGPGTENAVLTAWPKLGPGNEVDVTGEKRAPNGKLWYRIRIAGIHTGWVYGGFLDRR